MNRKIKFIGVGMKWQDRINGNSYRQTALKAMQKAKWIPKGDVWLFERENNYPIYWTCSEGLKKDVVAHGKID